MASQGEKKVSRRGFLKGAAIGAATIGGFGLIGGEAEAGTDGHYPAEGSRLIEYDFAKSSGALQPDRIVDSVCQFCNSLCRLKAHIKDGRVIDVLGEPEDPAQAGGLCVKGPMITRLVYDRYRLRQPTKRAGGEKGLPEFPLRAGFLMRGARNNGP